MNDSPEQARISAEFERTGASTDPFAAAVRATRMPMVITDPHQRDNPIVFANDAFVRLTGYARDEVLGRNCRFLQGPASDRNEVAKVRAAIAARLPIEIDLQNHRKDGSTFWNRLMVSPVFDRDGTVAYFFASQFESTLKHSRLQVPSDTAEQHDQILDVMIRSSSEVRYRVNADWSRLTQLVGGRFIADTAVENANWLKEYILPGDQEAVRAEIARAVATKSTYLIEHRVNQIDGSVGWASSRAVPLLDPAGEITGWFGSTSDITARKRAEAALSNSEAYWRSLFEQLNEGFMVVEIVRDTAGVAQTWRFAEINAAWERISGLSRAEAAGRSVEEVIPGVEREWINRYIQIAETGQPQTFQLPVHVLDQVYEIRASRVGPDRVSVLFQEISARQRDERHRSALLGLMDRLRDLDAPATMAFTAAEIMGHALRADRAGYATITGNGETLLIERDWTVPGFQSGAGLHRTASFGSAVSELGTGQPVVIADTAVDPRTAVDGGDGGGFGANAVRALVNQPLIEGGQLVAFFYVNTRTPRMWLEEEVAFIRDVAGHTRSVIERRRAERDLRQLAATLEQQVERRTAERDRAWRLSQHLLVTALPDGTIESINPMWTRLLGWQEREILGTSLADYTHPDDLVATLAAFAGILMEPLDTPYEYRFRHKDGSFRWFGWTAAFEDGRVYATGRDLTVEREQAEALRQSQKMEAVGQLTGGLAHDFNNLLTGISGSLELVQARTRQGRFADIERFVTAAQGAAKRAAALTHRLLAFSRRQTLDPKPTDVNQLVLGLQEMIQTTVGPGIPVEIVSASDIWPALVDPPQLENALLNLCINARDAMPDGGRITIETANRWLDARTARQQDVPEGQYLSLSVTDTGVGMPPEVMARVFEPFFTTKPVGQGTGLGLSMIYGFAKQSNGQVRIFSEVGRSTTVFIYLPRHHGQVDGEAHHHVTPGLPSSEQGEDGADRGRRTDRPHAAD